MASETLNIPSHVFDALGGVAGLDLEKLKQTTFCSSISLAEEKDGKRQVTFRSRGIGGAYQAKQKIQNMIANIGKKKLQMLIPRDKSELVFRQKRGIQETTSTKILANSAQSKKSIFVEVMIEGENEEDLERCRVQMLQCIVGGTRLELDSAELFKFWHHFNGIPQEFYQAYLSKLSTFEERIREIKVGDEKESANEVKGNPFTGNLNEDILRITREDLRSTLSEWDKYYIVKDSMNPSYTHIVTGDFVEHNSEMPFYFDRRMNEWRSHAPTGSFKEWTPPELRFTWETVSAFEYACHRHAHFEGNYFELITASLLPRKTCPACGLRDTLIWNGGNATSFRDFECRSCNAYFEVKTKKNKTSRRIGNPRNILEPINGGSYIRFKEQEALQKEHFLVVVDREGIPLKGCPENEFGIPLRTHQVYISKIHHVEPRPDQKAIAQFYSGYEDKMSIKSSIYFTDIKKWFAFETPNVQPANYFVRAVLNELRESYAIKIQCLYRRYKALEISSKLKIQQAMQQAIKRDIDEIVDNTDAIKL